ncbi:interleukin 17-like protein [Amphiura filiformis]|uniref:interleukin 17-like protein n=1 Tax=Amphiura filiformis TaxID=82378 RepID=UPI003B224174
MSNAFVIIKSGSSEMNTTTDRIERNKRNANCIDLSQASNSVIGLPVGQVLNSSDIQDIIDLQQPHNSGNPRYRNSTCPTHLLDTSHHLSLNRMNICPWVYITDTDDDRYPRDLSVAQCYCPNCIKTDNTGFDITSDSVCRPVFHKVHVLRKCADTCVNGVCKYQPDYELIPVACTCVRPITEE